MTIFPSQVVIIIALLLFLIYIFRVRTDLTDQAVFTIGVFTGIFFVIFPNTTTAIANLIGIGRGTDLILYCFIIVFLFYSTNIAARHRKLNRQITHIARAYAIEHPVKGIDDLQNQ